MRSLMPIVGLLFLIGCGGGPGAMNGGGGGGVAPLGNPPSARIFVTKPGTACQSKTVPPSHMLIKDDDDSVEWDLKIKGGCLDGDTHLVIKWHDGTSSKTVITDPASPQVPTTCVEITTKDNGNKNHIGCKLKTTAVGKFFYNVYLRAGGTDTLIEDPDVEIIMF